MASDPKAVPQVEPSPTGDGEPQTEPSAEPIEITLDELPGVLKQHPNAKLENVAFMYRGVPLWKLEWGVPKPGELDRRRSLIDREEALLEKLNK